MLHRRRDYRTLGAGCLPA